MSVVDILKETIIGTKVLKEPVFLKEDSQAKEQLRQLEEIYELADEKLKEEIADEIRCIKYGIGGENAIAYELKNSHIPMIVLHDLYLEHEGYKAQIDYLILTRKYNYVIECKNLYGNITVNNAGDFIRTISKGKQWTKEGVYSPITQNQRHLEVLKKVRGADKGTIKRMMFEHYFEDTYRSIVVLANPKTVIDMKFAKKEIKDKVIRCDQLIEYIKQTNKTCKDWSMSDKELMELGAQFLKYHKENPMDYVKKYRDRIQTNEIIEEAIVPVNIEESPMYQELKKYRLNKSREENIKAYYIYTNAQLEELIYRMPKEVHELKNLKGFNESKCAKYGDGIIEIVNKYR